MKKLLLILLCLPLLGFGQIQYKLDSIKAYLDGTPTLPVKFYYDSQARNNMVVFNQPQSIITDANNNIIYAYNKMYNYHEYNSNNQIMKIYTAFLNTNTQSIDTVSFINLIYDNNNNLIKSESQYTNFGNQIFSNSINFQISQGIDGKNKKTYTYSNNQLQLIEYWLWDGTTYNINTIKQYFWKLGYVDSVISYVNPPVWDTLSATNLYRSSVGIDSTLNDGQFKRYFIYKNISLVNTSLNFWNYAEEIWDIVLGNSSTIFPQQTNQIDSIIQPYSGLGLVVTKYYYSTFTGTDIKNYSSNNKKKELLKVIDLLGKETKGKKNTPLFYIYDDGTVEKKIIID